MGLMMADVDPSGLDFDELRQRYKREREQRQAAGETSAMSR